MSTRHASAAARLRQRCGTDARGAARRAAVARPRPSLLVPPADIARGRRPGGRAQLRQARHRDGRRPARAPAVRPSRLRAHAARSRSSRSARRRRSSVRGAQLPRAPDPPAPAHDPRGPGGRRHRAREGGLVQPGLPRRPAEGRGGAVAAGQARGGPRRRRPSGSPSTRSSAARRRRARGATRPGWCRSIRRPRACRRGASASWPGACAGSSATRSSRCPRACARGAACPREADALTAAHWPESLEEVAGRAPAPRASRSCSCSSWRS